MAEQPPITVKESWAAGRCTLGLAAIVSVIPATLGSILMALFGPETEEINPVFLPLWFGFLLLAITWLTYTGRHGATSEYFQRISRRNFDIYRGTVLAMPGFSMFGFGPVVAQVWRPAGLALIAAGVVLFVVGAVLGSRGGTRWLWLYPRPIRETGERPIWSEGDDEGPPVLYPAFAEHVYWLRRMRAKLHGGEPTRPLGRAGRLAAKQRSQSPATPVPPSPNPDPAPARSKPPSASLWSDDLAAAREADAEVTARTARPRSPKGLMLRASGRRPAPETNEPER